ncbi:hypothetical protein PO124_03185 [Bacillus licheniformis]|nr:hypothetical protein [Bacillus licheniformis]
MLAALSHLKEVRDDWVCWIAGDGERMAGLRIYAGSSVWKRCRVYEKRDDVPYLLSIADVYVCRVFSKSAAVCY